MKKVVGIVVLLVLIVVVLGGVLLLRNLGPIVKRVVESVGPKALGAPVTVADVSLSPFSGAGQIHGLVIGNPEGFNTPNAFSLGRVSIGMDLKSLRSDKTVINEIVVDQPEITLEMTLRGRTNLGQLVENAQAYAGPKKEEKQTAEGRPVVIRDLLVRGAKVHLSATALGGSTADLDLPEIRMTNIGEEGGGADAAQVIELVLATVVRSVVAQMGEADEIVAKVLEGVDDAAREAVTQARDELVGRIGEIEGKLTEELGAALGGAGGLLQGAAGVLGGDAGKAGGVLGGLTGALSGDAAGEKAPAASEALGKAIDEKTGGLLGGLTNRLGTSEEAAEDAEPAAADPKAVEEKAGGLLGGITGSLGVSKPAAPRTPAPENLETPGSGDVPPVPGEDAEGAGDAAVGDAADKAAGEASKALRGIGGLLGGKRE